MYAGELDEPNSISKYAIAKKEWKNKKKKKKTKTTRECEWMEIEIEKKMEITTEMMIMMLGKGATKSKKLSLIKFEQKLLEMALGFSFFFALGITVLLGIQSEMDLK